MYNKEEVKIGFRKFKNSVHNYKKFLGRVYRFGDNKINLSHEDFKDIVSKNEIGEIYKKILEFELGKRGFIQKGRIFVNNGVFVDLERQIVYDKKGDVVVKMLDKSGYLCSSTLEELFKIDNINGRRDGIWLMKKLRMAGINLEPQNFYLLADRLLKENFKLE